MFDKEIKLDFPIFAVHGNEILDQEITNIVEISSIIEDLNKQLDNTNIELDNIGRKIDLYINNVITRDKVFSYKEDLVIFNDKEELCIYSYDIIEEYYNQQNPNDDDDLEEEIENINNFMSNLFENLPETNDKYQLNNKQKAHVFKLVEHYNSLFEEYQYSLFELEEYDEEYKILLESVKKNLSQIKLMDVKKNDVLIDNEYKVEPFNNSKHELLITKDNKTSKWKFVYVRKKDSKKLFSLMESLNLE